MLNPTDAPAAAAHIRGGKLAGDVHMPATGRIFLLSPAHSGGQRARILSRPEAEFPLARRFQSDGAPLGEVFAFLSGLYFRGKLAYAERFASDTTQGVDVVLVITPSRGLLPPETAIGPAELEEFSAVRIDVREPRYREPLRAEAALLASALPLGWDVVLLGSVATGKYTDVLMPVLGERLVAPKPLIGMGDMQRGALLLRTAREGVELPYLPVREIIRTRR